MSQGFTEALEVAVKEIEAEGLLDAKRILDEEFARRTQAAQEAEKEFVKRVWPREWLWFFFQVSMVIAAFVSMFVPFFYTPPYTHSGIYLICALAFALGLNLITLVHNSMLKRVRKAFAEAHPAEAKILGYTK